MKKYPDKSDIINIGISNEKNTKKNRQSILPFPADRGAGKCTFTSFLQETGRNIPADIAQASEFIETKNDRYESSIAQGGSNVSGGDRKSVV